MINKLDDGIYEVLPIARRNNGSNSAEPAIYSNNDTSLQVIKCKSSVPRLMLFRVLPLVLFAFIGGTNLINLYATDDALEDVEYRQITQQYINAHEVNNTSNAIFNNSDYPTRLPRWKQIGNDCAAGQRLANTTDLYCGVAPQNGKVMIEPLITNEHNTCGGIPLQPNHCLMPSRGQWTWELSNQTMPLLPRRFGTPYNMQQNRSQSTLPLCKSPNDFYYGTQQGSAQDFDREWVPNSCSVVPLNPFDWTQHSKCQVTIVMMGDSHIRNLFTATVHGLRGDSAFVESHPDNKEKDAGTILTYEWHKESDDGTASDSFEVHTNTNNKNLTHLLEDYSCNEKSARHLRIVFIWAPRFDDQIKHVHLLNHFNPDLIIVEPGNSYETSTALSQEWTSAMDAILAQNEYRHLAILHFPYGPAQPHDREAAINAWIDNSSSSNNTSRANNRMSYWQQGKLGLSGMQARRTWHYACGLGRMHVRNDVVQAIELCTDEADTAYIRAITTVHFDAFREH